MKNGKNRWDVADREILITLFSNVGEVDIYSLHERFNLLPSKIIASIRKLQEINVLTFDPERMLVSLTESGRFWVVANRREIFLQKIDQPWKAPPSSYVRFQIGPTTPYVPKRRYISKDFFESLIPKN